MDLMNYEYEWYFDRLDDVTLLDNAIDVFGMLAVPLGGNRLAGNLEIYFPSLKLCRREMIKLQNNSVFPNLRIEQFSKHFIIKWGCIVDKFISNKSKGRLFGYKESILMD